MKTLREKQCFWYQAVNSKVSTQQKCESVNLELLRNDLRVIYIQLCIYIYVYIYMYIYIYNYIIINYIYIYIYIVHKE